MRSESDLRLAWHHLTRGGEVSVLRLLLFAYGSSVLLMTAIGVFLALEPTP